MIPNLPILQTPLRRSGFNSSFYNPHNYILKEEDKIVESHDSSFISDSYDYHSTHVHELTHWIQHHGTTFGAFLNAICQTQQLTTITNLRELPSSVSRDLLLKRKDGIPIVNINPINQQFERQSFSSHEDDLNMFGQIWFDLQWIYSFMNDSDCSPICPNNQVFGDSIADIYLYSSMHNNTISGKAIQEVRKWYNFTDKQYVVKYKNTNLSSSILMECGAACNELQLLYITLNSIIGAHIATEQINKRLKIIAESSYGLPFRIFSQTLGDRLYVSPNVCSTINALIFIALNPPLPPFSYGSPDNSDSWDWQDIYPPIRFIRAMEVVQDIGLLNFYSNHEETINYIYKVIEHSSIPTIIDNVSHIKKDQQELDFSKPIQNIDMNHPYFSVSDYTYWVQKNLFRLRDKSIHFLANLGTCFNGIFSTEFAELIIGNETVPYIHPPFRWSSDGNIKLGPPSIFYNSLLRLIGVDYSLFDLTVGHFGYDLTAFPPKVCQSKNFIDMIEQSIYETICVIRNS